jgi:hypothetical protein
VVTLTVSDAGPGFVPRPPAPDLDSEAGRGLLIVDALADRWGVDTSAGTRVWAEVDLVADEALAAGATRRPAPSPPRS